MEGRRSVEGRVSCDACPGHCAGTSMPPKQRAHGSELHGYPIPRRPITSDLRQEPGALVAHAGICAGAESNLYPYRHTPTEHVSVPLTSGKSAPHFWVLRIHAYRQIAYGASTGRPSVISGRAENPQFLGRLIESALDRQRPLWP